MDFSQGLSGSYREKNESSYLICVRGNELPEADFTTLTINNEQIVIDSSTGLVWQGIYTSKNWQQALEYCENLTYAGYDDWRLPNKNELASLLNYDKTSAPYSDFPDMPSGDIFLFWSSSTLVLADSTNGAWSVNFNEGYVASAYKTDYEYNYVRCVRSE